DPAASPGPAPRRRDRRRDRRRLRAADPTRGPGAADCGVSAMLIPNRSLVWLAIVPLVLAAMVPFEESLLWPMLLADAGIVLLAIVDALITSGKLLSVSRSTPEVFSIGRPNPVTVELRSRTRRRLRVEVTC